MINKLIDQEVLKTYNKFKKLVEFCYFNDSLKDLTPFQRYIYYFQLWQMEKNLILKMNYILK